MRNMHSTSRVVFLTGGELKRIFYYLVILSTGVSGYFYENTTNSRSNYLTLDNEYLQKGYRGISHKAGREPRFISFETRDNSIEVEMSFNIPFISIPVKKSMNSAQDLATAMMDGTPLANINLGAIALAAALGLGGIWIGGISKTFAGGFFNFAGKSGKTQRGEHYDQGALNTFFELVDRSLQKYDIDSTACTQRAVCWFVKNAHINVSDGKATSSDKIINGITNSGWAMELTAGTAINDAIKVGKRLKNCERTYSACKLTSNYIKEITDKYLREKNKNF